MNEKLLLEYVDRVGIVTLEELAGQTGSAGEFLYRPVRSLIAQKQLFFCRLGGGRETLLSNHLLFCLLAVYAEPELSADAQEIFDWLCDNEPAAEDALRAAAMPDGAGFPEAFAELQRKLSVAPVGDAVATQDRTTGEGEITAGYSWVTIETWLDGVRRPGRYRELEYCISEIRRLLKGYFSTRELNALIYRGAL
ncbi:hypothetical protein LJC60_08015 [Ruminococcaceae bacterium OttesenSCG-928-D13]|nr:hypothetical protein [Ruminococcaceae bacterium OttesenSCG-928-D13]